jgi:flagellar hook-associated protein 3 FlgL
MRLSTQSFYTGSLAAMQLQSAELAKLQNQVALGKRVSTPADDPIAAVHILELERAQSESEQFAKNSTLVKNRLNLEEQAIADVGTILTRVRELTLQASNIGTLNEQDRISIATELANRLTQLQDVANRQDGNGEYLFAGFSTLTRPFTGGGNAPVSYVADQGSRVVQVSPTQRVQDSHSGFDVFMEIPEGNGTFTTSLTPANTGSGAIDVGVVVDPTAWVSDNYTITFTTPTTWEVTDSATPTPNIVASGAFTSGGPIEFNGVRVEVTGDPAAGDTFSVRQARSESIFDTIEGIVAALRQPGSSANANAKLATALEGSLQQIDQASDHMLGLRAEVGARLSTLEAADSSREALDIDLASSLSDLRDLDYAEALTKMNQRLVGLQAAQLSYSQISQLSLFNYLK